MSISLIPVSVDIYQLTQGVDLFKIIADTPKLVLSILPLYFPVLWMAFKANKQINLSKRLIEEYTHKEVLSRTVEGLSTQIDNINDDSISAELRVRLLHNILEISSENPGKLISNYNKADNPVMDALEKSASLAKSLNKVANLPGLFKILDITNRSDTAKKKLKEVEDEVDVGLEAVQPKK